MKLALALGAAALLTLAACGTETSSHGTGDTAGDDPAPTPTASTPAGTKLPAEVPAAKGQVIGQGTVMDTGRPELCLGAIAESYPPQCSGLPIVGWDWAQVAGQFEKSGDTRWGAFVLTGTFDGTTFTMTAPAKTLALHDPAPVDVPDPFPTPCPEPDGGWVVVDPATTNDQTLQQVFEKASRLDGYAGAWMDQSPNPSRDEGEMNDPTRLVVNVTVTGDVEAAEAELRRIWGGALCVSRAKYTEADLLEIQTQLQKVPGLLTSSAQNDRVTAEVIHDDGTIQAWADQEYGAGRVVFSSALKPA